MFDEATVNLDSVTENKIIKLITELDVTKIVVTHTPEKFLNMDHNQKIKVFELDEEGSLKRISSNYNKQLKMTR
ncbi:MAG: hypothetical protein V4501_02915 [Pseudomonadota bacterium]